VHPAPTVLPSDSGNTFLRIVIGRLYGHGSSTVYPVDGVLERLGGHVVTAGKARVSLAEMRDSSDVHFVKTHRRRDYDVCDVDAALYLVRDGRDALVSFARQRSEDAPERYHDALRALIDRHTGGTASWGQNVLSWLHPAEPARLPKIGLMRFEELTQDPIAAVTNAVNRVAPDLPQRAEVTLPAFDELQQIDGGFFRRGVVGTHREEMTAELEELFWSYEDNRDGMERLGYGASGRQNEP
jgi:hypothetical protein